MKKIISTLIVFLFIINLYSIEVFAKEGDSMPSQHIYVDINGDDSTADGSKEKPFVTINKAKEYVKTLDKSNGDIVVEIADGTYYLSEPLTFDESDSGNDDCTIHYVAATGANPVISGGKEILGVWNNEGNGVYSITYNRNRKLRALYVNGKRCNMTSNVIKAQGGTKKLQ